MTFDQFHLTDNMLFIAGFFAILFVLFLIFLWVLLPFAVFGIKDKINQLIESTDDININIKLLRMDIQALNKPASKEIFPTKD